MNIGIDVDGVILDTENYFRTYAELYDLDTYNSGFKDRFIFNVQERYTWGKDEIYKYMEKYGYDAERNAPLLPGVKEVLTRLKKMGHNLIVITARGSLDPREEQFAFDRLVEEGLPLDKVIVRAIDKLIPCKENQIDIMIDDAPGNVEYLSDNGIECLYMRYANGKQIDKKGVTEVYNWGEVLRYFMNKKESK